MQAVFSLNDQRGFTNNEVIDYILSQQKVRELFARLTKQQTAQMIGALIQSMKVNKAYENQG